MVHNVVAASAVVGLVGREGEVIRKTGLVFFYYALFTGAIGYGVITAAGGSLFNTGFVIATAIVLGAIALIAKYGAGQSMRKTI